MRTVPFRSVFDRVVQMHGRDPKLKIKPSMREGLVAHINERARTICQVWRWPQWELTEERGFRQIWNATHQYLRASLVDGLPDEVLYLPNMTYYRVDPDAGADPPVGIPPTASPITSARWILIDPVDTFIEYDQTCRRSIGMVLGVYSRNPRVPTGSACGGLRFQPSERGVDIPNPGNPTVFLHYKMPVPKYTMLPYVPGKTYSKGTTVFDPTVGECFQALVDTANLPSNTSVWRRVPFPEEWFTYVTQGAFADSLMEFDQGGNEDLQAKAALAMQANSKADMLLDVEVDTLSMQGQKLQWNFATPLNGCCESAPWTGGTVTTLTEECQDELGWVYPTAVAVPQIVWQYRPEISALLGTPHTLQALSTRLWLPGSRVEIEIPVSGVRTIQTWVLIAGPADPDDPGEVSPSDHDATTNNKHWEQRA